MFGLFKVKANSIVYVVYVESREQRVVTSSCNKESCCQSQFEWIVMCKLIKARLEKYLFNSRNILAADWTDYTGNTMGSLFKYPFTVDQISEKLTIKRGRI